MLDILVYYGIMATVESLIVSVPDRCSISILQNYSKLSRDILVGMLSEPTKRDITDIFITLNDYFLTHFVASALT